MTTPVSRGDRRAQWLQRGKRVVRDAIVTWLAIVVLLAIFQRSLIYHPTRVGPSDLANEVVAGATIENVKAPGSDGSELCGWFISPRPPSQGKIPQPAPEPGKRLLVLYFCGNAGHRGYRMEEFEILTSCGADVLCCDYRGYGENAGRPTEEGLAADARSVWNYAVNTRGVAPGRIVIMGESLGGAVAVRLAAEVASKGATPAGLILRSTFSSLEEVAATTLPWVPVRWLLRDRYRSAEWIGEVNCPILQFHGRNDTIVSFESGTRLFAMAPPRSSSGIPKRWIELPRADHNDVLSTEGGRFRSAVKNFLAQIAPADSIAKVRNEMLGPIVRSLIYQPVKARDLAPSALGLLGQNVHPIAVETSDALRLNGWHLLAAGRKSTVDDRGAQPLPPLGWLSLFFSGNGGHRAWRLPEIEIITAAGADVFIFDYRGYGDNRGAPSESRIAADAQTIWQYATSNRGVPRERVVLYGESLGGAIAIRLAAELCRAGTPPAGLIVRSTFTSLADVGARHYPWLPVRMVLCERYSSLEQIRDVTCPLLVLHGRRDVIVPFEQGERLFAAAPAHSAGGTVRTFVELASAGHNDVIETEGPQMRQAIFAFFSRL